MRQLSDGNVTQHDRVANPLKEATVVHVSGISALHEAFKSPVYVNLSRGARALFTFICLKSRKYGCTFYRIEKIAAATGLHRRIVCLKRRELEDAGCIRTVRVRRGDVLPSGQIAARETAVFYPQRPPAFVPPENPIMDPTMINHDRQDHGRDGHTPFSDLLELEEDPDVAKTPNPERAPAPISSEPLEPLALRILQQWRNRLMPNLVIDPESGRAWLRIVMARLEEGFTERQCCGAIEAHRESPHNRHWKRRTVDHVFGDAGRLHRMSQLGVSIPPPLSDVRKAFAMPQEPTSGTIVVVPEKPTDEDIEAIFDQLNGEASHG